MRTFTLLMVLVGIGLLTGCTSLLSVHPLATEETRVSDEGLLGVWRDSDNEMYLIREKDRRYEVIFAPRDGSVLQFEGYLVPAGCARILDLQIKKAPEFTIAAHFFVRVERHGDTLRFAFLDSEWLRKQISPETGKRERALLTASSREVRQIVGRYACEDQAYSGEAELRRVR
jgi:hypothetical protein